MSVTGACRDTRGWIARVATLSKRLRPTTSRRKARAATVLCGAFLLVSLTTHGVASAQAGETLVCTHPFTDEHPLVTGFLLPWAAGITTDARGGLRIEIEASEAPGPDCALALGAGQIAEVVSMPFALFDQAELSSVITYEALAQSAEPVSGMLAAVALGHDVVSLDGSTPPPLPGGLEGHAVAPPTPVVEEVLRNLGADTEGSREAHTAALLPLVEAADAEWVLTFDAGRSLYTEPYVLSVTPERLASLPASARALIRQSEGRKLSAAAGRAIDRARAVVLEASQIEGRHHSLTEDRVGAALSGASEISRTWSGSTEGRRESMALFERVRSELAKVTW